MIKKIICLVLIIILSIPIKYVHAEKIEPLNGNVYQSKYYDEDTDTFNIVDPQSGAAIAVGGSIASLLLTIAVKAGMDFPNAKSIDDFLLEFCGYNAAKDFLISLKDLIVSAGSGVINVTRSVLDEFKRVTYEKKYKDVNMLEVGDMKIPIIKWNETNKDLKKMIILNAPMSQSAIFNAPTEGSIDSYLKLNGQDIKMELNNIYNPPSSSGYNNSIASLKCTFKDASGNWSIVKEGGNALWGGKQEGTFCKATYFALQKSETEYIISIEFLLYQSGSSFSQMVSNNSVQCYDSSGKMVTWNKYFSDVVSPPYVDPGYSDAKPIPGTDGTTDSDLTVGIPSDLNDIINKNPSDVTETPTWDIWNPGQSITKPDISNPSVDITDDMTIPGVEEGTKPDPDPNPDPKPDPEPIPPIPALNFDPLKVGIDEITKRFPFSLPWDLQRILLSFKGETQFYDVGKAPVLDIDFNGQDLKLDFAKFEPLAMIIRGFLFTEVSICLLFILRKLKP